MKLNAALERYIAVLLLLVAVAALLAASVLILVAVYLLGMELLGQGNAHRFCPASNSTVNCTSRWWAPMVGSLVLILMGSVLWPIGVRKLRKNES